MYLRQEDATVRVFKAIILSGFVSLYIQMVDHNIGIYSNKNSCSISILSVQ